MITMEIKKLHKNRFSDEGGKRNCVQGGAVSISGCHSTMAPSSVDGDLAKLALLGECPRFGSLSKERKEQCNTLSVLRGRASP